MKVAVSAERQDLDGRASPVFGRCECFVVAEVEDGVIRDSYCLENSAARHSSGAGTACAQLIGEEGVDVLITGSIGPKAHSALAQWNVDLYESESGTVRENVEMLGEDSLDQADSPSNRGRRKGGGRGRGKGRRGN